MGTEIMFSFLMICLVLAIYFIPTFIAYFNKHRHFNAIFLINLLLGWTFIGWVVALVWCYLGNDPVKEDLVRKRGRPRKE